MCRCVILDGRGYCTQAELLTICPKGLVYWTADTPHEPDCCLCPVEIDNTARLNGFVADCNSDSFNDIFKKARGCE